MASREGETAGRRDDAALSGSTQRKRAAIDAGAGLIITMLLWPFPIARALLAPAVNVVAILLAWLVVNVAYHVIGVRIWCNTAGTHLLGLEFATGNGADMPGAQGMARWAWRTGLFVVAEVAWPRLSAGVERSSGVELRD